MPHLSPPTLTHSEQKTILRATSCNPRDHLVYSLALGTGLRLAEIVGLNVGDVYIDDGVARTRLKIRPEIAKGGRTGDVFLPDALMGKLRKFVGVGIAVARDPLHRSGRAGLPHPAPTSRWQRQAARSGMDGRYAARGSSE